MCSKSGSLALFVVGLLRVSRLLRCKLDFRDVGHDRFAMSARCSLLPRADIPLRFAQQLWKLGDVGGDAAGRVAGTPFQ
jgi:hypothetical protein